MKTLHVIPTLNPLAGGPGVALSHLVLEMRAHNVVIDIVCLDEENSDFFRNFSCRVVPLGSGFTKYAFNWRLIPWLKSHIHEYDAIVVNGLWQYTGLAVWLTTSLAAKKIPYFVFPHGMLDPWFKHAFPFKHLKKWLYWPWAEYQILRHAENVIFTSEEERLLARKSFWLYKVREEVTAYGIHRRVLNGDKLSTEFIKNYPVLKGKRIILFLSRIHVKKGCDLLLNAFAKSLQHDANLHLLMVGPDETGWIRKLQSQAKKLRIQDDITWIGMLQGDMKWGAFYSSEVFCLPSHQENFGIVVAEALSCGIPVLISNKVNIWREIQRRGAGLVCDDTQVGVDNMLESWIKMNPTEFQLMKSEAVPCFNENFTMQKAATTLFEIIKRGMRHAARQ